MKALSDYALDYADLEFSGGPYNGPSLMKTLRSLSIPELLSKETYEGYSAWEVAVHVAFYKRKVGNWLGASIPESPLAAADFSPSPPGAGQKEAEELFRYRELCHAKSMQAARAASPEALESIVDEWKIPLGMALAWLLGHDAYHSAQIRNMGLPSFRKK
jgi:hypothetical protein